MSPAAGGTPGPDPVPYPEVVLDCRGKPCPLPIIELGRHLGDVAVGGLLGVAATDPAARYDVPAWARMRAQTYLGALDAPDGVPVYVVRREG
ncbi:MAG: sulfurtransferase TusA family protein [Nocardioides sp.]|uniref:sulfurtransferase TusA family protein n=1 Tax=Nocardioides sp. TaxID=35761 RepID=UPI0039E4C7A2